jgi:hypothetical protein
MLANLPNYHSLTDHLLDLGAGEKYSECFALPFQVPYPFSAWLHRIDASQESRLTAI